MAKINVKPEKLEQVATNLIKIASELENQKNKLMEVNSTIEAEWISDYTRLFLNEVGTVEANIMKLSEATDEIARELRNVAENVRQVEEENVRVFQHTDGGGSW